MNPLSLSPLDSDNQHWIFRIRPKRMRRKDEITKLPLHHPFVSQREPGHFREKSYFHSPTTQPDPKSLSFLVHVRFTDFRCLIPNSQSSPLCSLLFTLPAKTLPLPRSGTYTAFPCIFHAFHFPSYDHFFSRKTDSQRKF